MSENQWWEILLSELQTVRIVCQHRVPVGTESRVCGAILEVPLKNLASVKKCPMCENWLHPVAEALEDPFLKLEPALRGLRNLQGVAISFVLPVRN